MSMFGAKQYEVSHDELRITVTATRAYNAVLKALPGVTIYSGRLEQPVKVDRGYGDTIRSQWSFAVADNGYRVWVTEV